MLNQRNRVRLRQFGRRMMGKRQGCSVCNGDCMPLSELPTGSNAIVLRNHDTRTIERGLYDGASLEVYRNELTEPNLIVAVQDSRYVLDRRIARMIRVRVAPKAS